MSDTNETSFRFPITERIISLEEVRLHDQPNDCWTVINDRVYDITSFLRTHPGGSIIRLAAGRDATSLYQAYHPHSLHLNVRRLLYTLPKLGLLDKPNLSRTDNALFYFAVKQRVEQFLDREDIGYHSMQIPLLIETYITLCAYFASAFYVAQSGSILASILNGFLTGRLGFIMHTGNHRAASGFGFINSFLGKLMNLIGGSQLVWLHEHQIAHHIAPNQLGHDNDCEIGYPWIRLHPRLKVLPEHIFQPLSVFVGMTFGLMKWFISDFTSFRQKQIGYTRISFIGARDKVEFYLGKATYFAIHIVAPLCCLPVSTVLLTLFTKVAVGSHYLENIFIVNHIQTPLFEPSHVDPESEPDSKAHWAIKQVKSTSNWSSGSEWWNWFSGGLNHQIEHHLFPSMHPYLYPRISSIVRRTCAEFELPYYDYSSFGSAWLGMTRHLFRMRNKTS